MASRRDQLNAYTFARKRMVAAFLQPSATGSEEGAPRPLRAIVPSMVAGALVLAGFGAWGLIKPTAPPGWDTPGAHVLVGSESTTRYIIWANGKKQKPELRPVLNLATAKLLLNPDTFSVMKVDESILDHSKYHLGATIGIPFAPDRLPAAADAATAKPWAMCVQPHGNDPTAEPQKATFVLGGPDRSTVSGAGKVGAGKALFVKTVTDDPRDPVTTLYLVDPAGTVHKLVPDSESIKADGGDLLKAALFPDDPQRVTTDWIGAFNKGSDISIPLIAGFGDPAGVPALGAANHIGMVVKMKTGTEERDYVVLKNGAAPITPFIAELLMFARSANGMYGSGTPQPAQANQQEIATTMQFPVGADWPKEVPTQVNVGSDTTACAVYHGTMPHNRPDLGLWVGSSYPKKTLTGGVTSAYVTPGSGLLFRAVSGEVSGGGHVFLVTDTGLRYSIPRNATAPTDNGQKTRDAQSLLGYGKIQPVDVPANWADFLPKGPDLSQQAATREQDS